jgi:hypothetical protein
MTTMKYLPPSPQTRLGGFFIASFWFAFAGFSGFAVMHHHCGACQ